MGLEDDTTNNGSLADWLLKGSTVAVTTAGAGAEWAPVIAEAFDDGKKKSTDTDGDGKVDEEDNCDRTANPDQTDEDGSGVGDECEPIDEPQVSQTVEFLINAASKAAGK